MTVKVGARIGKALPKAANAVNKAALVDKIAAAKKLPLLEKKDMLITLQHEVEVYGKEYGLDAQLNRLLQPLADEVVQNEEFIKAQESVQAKWLQQGMNKELLTSHPDFVQFAVETGLIFSIILFDDTKGVHVDASGMPCIKMQGQWVAWDSLKKQLRYDAHKATFVSTTNPKNIYFYIASDGFVRKDSTKPSLFPVRTLTPAEQKAVLEAGEGFWKTHPEVDPGKPKECALQFVSTGRECMPRNWLTENFLDLGSQHTTIRLVDKEGRLYTFGIKVSSELVDYVGEHPFSFLATGYGKVVTPDYEETRVYDRQLVTTVPITPERLALIVAFANQLMSGPGMRFCQTKQNCNSLAVAIGHLAGLQLDTTMTLPEVATSWLPSFSKLPLVGRVVRFASSVFETLASFTPSFVTYVPRKISTFVSACIFSFFGGMREAEVECGPKQVEEITSFSRLFTSFWDLFDEEKVTMHHSYKMVAWHRQHHAATREFFYEGKPVMHL